MKKILFICLLGLLFTSFSSNAQNSKKGFSKQEKKEMQKALEMRLFDEAKEAIENKSFVLEADRLVFKYGNSAYVSSSTNFISVDDDDATVQVAFNVAASGPNGLGGVTVEGRLSNFNIKYDKKGNMFVTMSISGVGLSATVALTMRYGNNTATANINPNFNSNIITLDGNIIPFEKTRTFKGMAL